MREIKFRAWHTDFKKMFAPEEMGRDQMDLLPDGSGFWNIHGGSASESVNIKAMVLMHFTGLVDMQGVEIFEEDLLNVFYTSGDGEHIHDCIYSVESIESEGIKLKFQRLLWESYGYNQYPSSCELSVRYGSLDIIHDKYLYLEVRNTYGTNQLRLDRWKEQDQSRFFNVIGNIRENPELMQYPQNQPEGDES